MTNTLTPNDRGLDMALRLAAWGGAVGLWLLPLVAMQFTREVDWTATDFAVWAVLLLGGAGLFELSLRFPGGLAYRAASVIALGGCFVLIWGNLAVGLIGSEDNPANLMFVGVLAIGAIGAFATRLRPGGLSRVMVAMAIAQMLAVGLATFIGWDDEAGASLIATWFVSSFFAALWLLAAGLFSVAARQAAPKPSGAD